MQLGMNIAGYVRPRVDRITLEDRVSAVGFIPTGYNRPWVVCITLVAQVSAVGFIPTPPVAQADRRGLHSPGLLVLPAL